MKKITVTATMETLDDDVDANKTAEAIQQAIERAASKELITDFDVVISITTAPDADDEDA